MGTAKMTKTQFEECALRPSLKRRRIREIVRPHLTRGLEGIGEAWRRILDLAVERALRILLAKMIGARMSAILAGSGKRLAITLVVVADV